jgi:hypothetical protein
MKIDINDDLYDDLSKLLNETSYMNITDLIEYVLEEYLVNNSSDKSSESTDESKNQLNKRLKDLGYL